MNRHEYVGKAKRCMELAERCGVDTSEHLTYLANGFSWLAIAVALSDVADALNRAYPPPIEVYEGEVQDDKV